MVTTRHIADLREVAEIHHGVFSLAEAELVGINQATVFHLIQRGWVRPVRRGIYTVGAGPGTPWDSLVAAALAAGEGAVLSHWSAAAILGFDGTTIGDPEVTINRACRRRLDGVTLHRMGPVPADRQFQRRGVWVTTAIRTLLDLAAATDGARLGGIVDDGLVRRLWTPATLRAAVRDETSRPGIRLLRKLVDERPDSIDSRLEQRVLRFLDPFRPFEVHYQIVLGGRVYIVDVAWPWCKVAVEIDGRTYRTASRTAFERETRKLNALTHAEWLVVHLSAGMGRQACRDTVAAALEQRGMPSWHG